MALFVGIDVSKEKLDVAIRPTGEFWSVSNSLQGWTELSERLADLPVSLVVMEHSGGYQQGAFLFLSAKGFPVALVNAKAVRDFARGMGKLAKTDRVDAFVLAPYGEAAKPSISVPLNETKQRLKALMERREQLVKMAGGNRLKQAEGRVWGLVIFERDGLGWGTFRGREGKVDERAA